MTKIEKLEKLLEVAELRYLQEHARIQDILEHEGRIRKALSHLDEQRTQASKELSSGSVMQSTGADILWQSWAASSRTSLNLQLAQVLARKEQLFEHVKKAFGQKEAVKSVLSSERKAIKNKTTQQQCLRLLGQ